MWKPFGQPEELALLMLSSLNWNARECLPIHHENGPEYRHVGRYSEGAHAWFVLAPNHKNWSEKYEAYIFEPPFWVKEQMTVRYTRRREVGRRDEEQGLFTTTHDGSGYETVGAKLCLHMPGNPFPERLTELNDHELEMLNHQYRKFPCERGPKNFDFFDFDFFGYDEERLPIAVGRKSRSMNIYEPDLPGQVMDESDIDSVSETSQDDRNSNPSSDEEEEYSLDDDTVDDLGWTGRWVDKLVAAKERGGPMPTRKDIKWYHNMGGEKIWGAEIVFTPINFELYEPEMNTKHPHKCLQAYTVVATVKRVFVTPKWFEVNSRVTGNRSYDQPEQQQQLG